MFIKIIKRIFIFLFNDNFSGFYLKSYSQEGEDMILNKLLERENKGFYIDIGAHHPKRFSNTYFFYKKGWAGINIDAKPGSMKAFNKKRPRDINIELGVSSKEETINFYIFNEPALNTFDENLANSRICDKYHIIETVSVKCMSLNGILDQYLPPNIKITFLTIDIEGYDLKVLATNDWNKYRPEYLIVESYELYVDKVIESEIYKYLSEKDYKLVSKSYYSLIFKNSLES
jgi:FkbM family methyltransferase